MCELLQDIQNLYLHTEGHVLPVEYSSQVCSLEYPSCMDDDIYEVCTTCDMDLLLQELDMDNLIPAMSRLPPEMLSPAIRSPLGACSSRSAQPGGSGRRRSSCQDGASLVYS